MIYPRGSFLGLDMAQTPQALIHWERFLSQLRFRRLIEIGTGSSALSLFLYLFCIERNAMFRTYDIAKRFHDSNIHRHVGFHRVFREMDVFKAEEQIRDLLAGPGMSILFCDGGNKPKEAQTFAPALKVGDILALHDWGREVQHGDIEHLSLEPVCLATFDSHTGVFRKMETDA